MVPIPHRHADAVMFGLRRSTQPASLDWPTLLSLLEDDDRRAAVGRTFPNEGRESFLSALQRIDRASAHNVRTAGRQLHTASQLIDRPTVAVAGMLNSGKTSLVASFLSEQGQRRSLRGTNNSEGTHRFVLWLPSAWKQDLELWGLLMSRLGDALGHAPEPLEEDPLAAHAQYNNRGGNDQTLAVPLVATDPALDALGIGLLDCPDIVSDEEFGLGSPETRRSLLGRAATLCSAFLVVSSAESSRDATLGDLLRIASDLMPGIPRLLAINKVRPRQSPDQVLETFQPLAKSHGIEAIYAAYDFDVPGSHPYIPQADDPSASHAPDQDPLPVFFLLDRDPDRNPPASISSDRLLRALPDRLDRGQLFEKFRIALESGLRTAVWEEGFATLASHTSEAVDATHRAQRILLDAALEFFAHREIGGEVLELRLIQNERIIHQLYRAFAENAPWYARFSVRISTTMQRFVGGATALVRQLTPTAIAERTANEIKEKFSRGEYGSILSPERLGAAIERHGGIESFPHWSQPERFSSEGSISSRESKNRVSAWEEACAESIQRFERDDFTEFDRRRLNEAVQQMWREVPMHKKLTAGLTPLAAMLATFGGVLMIPIDLGATFIASASIPELFAAIGLTTLSAMWAGGQNTRNVGQQAARQQLAIFHVILCDTFGVARPDERVAVRIGKVAQSLPSTEKVVVRGAVGPTLTVYVIREEFRLELQRMLPRGGGA